MYVFRLALADRVLASTQAGGASLVWLGVVVAGLVAGDGPLHPQNVAPALLALMASSSLMPLAAVALAPWSFGLMRHR
jgi:hypothetical protein